METSFSTIKIRMLRLSSPSRGMRKTEDVSNFQSFLLEDAFDGSYCYLLHIGREYLGLTGARINGIEMLACGLATHFVLSKEEEMETGTDKWIVEAISSLKSASPTSLKITLRSIREGRVLKLEHCLSREFTLFRHFMRRTVNNDFYEGARAMLIDKDKKPKWEPPQLWQVSEEMVDRFFAEAEDDDEWENLHLPNRSGLSNPMKPKL
ncbi:hypothetical protein TEA_022759 [Camellia sinensis var. sinensis]|uniref:3-hydroxyisobutyryl-CoA hydrolase n=1 Tax=Camellia sinensis var. sinensis TaxID=542762 RepID=A0A4S4D6T0_CAMSN|nr:hypothetical protein TEA_022759 [Camellia sinensis var. sinensis]